MSSLKAARAGALYFIVIFALGFMLGVVRTVFLNAYSGIDRLTGVLIELPIMLLARWLVSGIIIRRFAVASAVNARAVMGATAFALLIGAEMLVGVLMFERTMAEHFQLYREPSYLAGLLAQVLFALMPIGRMVLGRDTVVHGQSSR